MIDFRASQSEGIFHISLETDNQECFESAQKLISLFTEGKDIELFDDGYHTFESLYEQRAYLFATVVKAHQDKAWKSRLHADGKPCFGGGWFIVGVDTPHGQYTYHYKDSQWKLFSCKEIETAPVWDGHTDKDVQRLLWL